MVSARSAQTSGEQMPSNPPSRQYSVWAILAFLLSVSIFCPLFGLLGPLFALRSLAEIQVNPTLRGKRLAYAAIVLGLISAIGWTVGTIYWHQHARKPMLAGPVVELRAGLNGNLAWFKAGFIEDATDQEAREFLGELDRRYGVFLGIEQNATAKGAMPVGGQGRIPYVLHFRSGDVRGEALFVTFGGSMFKPVFKWRWIRVIDAQQGDLFYPVSASAAASPAPAAQP